MPMYRKLTTAAAVAALAFGLAACGGGGGDGPTTSVDDLDWSMLAGASIPAGTYEIAGAPEDLLEQAAALDVPEGGYAPGDSEILAGYTLTCASNSPTNCNVAVNEDGTVTTTGTITVTTHVAMPEPPTMPEPTPVAVTVPDAMYLDAANIPTAGSMTIAAGMTGTSGGVTFLCAEGGEDCEVTVADDGSVTATGGDVTASLTADAMEQVADAKQMKSDDEAEMAQMARDRAIGQASAMASPGNAPGITSISHPAGKAVSVVVTGFKPTEMQPGMLGSFTGVSLSNTSSATATQYMTVYTDIAEPKKREFFNYDGDDDTPAAYESATLTRPAGDALPLVPSPDGTSNQGRFNAGNVDLTIFPTKGPSTGGTVTKTFEANYDSDDNNTPDQVRLPGTFDGARGTYLCAAAECVVSVTPAGVYSFGTGQTWTFTPNDGEMAYHEDAEFLRFGWWMMEPARSTGTYQFATFANGSPYRNTRETADDGAGVTGEATYSGNAAGRYSVGDDAGAFTANASLTAKFGTGAATDFGSISGMISGFQGDADMSGWSVELKKITLSDFAAAADGTDVPAAFASATTGNGADRSSSQYNGTIATLGDTMAHGTWSGSFYGNARNSDTGSNAIDAAPLAVGGQFNASGASAIISGAFGARRPQ